jgi:hypothetical protein
MPKNGDAAENMRAQIAAARGRRRLAGPDETVEREAHRELILQGCRQNRPRLLDGHLEIIAGKTKCHGNDAEHEQSESVRVHAWMIPHGFLTAAVE